MTLPQDERESMTNAQRNEYIEDLIFYTRIARSYYEQLPDARLLEEWEKMRLIN